MRKFLALLLASCLAFIPLAFSASDGTYFDTDTKLMLHGDGTDGSTTITDSSTSGRTVTPAGDAQIDTAQKVFGTGSVLFDGTGDYATVPNSADFLFGSGDFTIDFRVRFSSVATSQTIIGVWDRFNNNASWLLQWSSSNVLAFTYTPSGGGTGQTGLNFSWTPSADTWYHVSVVRSGNNLYSFVDGTQIGSTADVTGITFYASTADLYIGEQQNTGGGASPANLFTGWLDELRVVKGTAVWTSNFTPPSAAYTATPTTSVKTVNGLAYASIKTKNGLAKASVKTWDGLA